MEFNDGARFTASPDYIHRKIAGKNVLVSIGGNIANFNGYIQLNDTAAFLWEQLAEPKTADELAAALLAEFDVAPDQAAADVMCFLDELLESEMVTTDG